MKNRPVTPERAIQKHLSFLLLVCVYGVLFCASVYGIDRDRTIHQFHHTAWTAKDGAPEQIKAIAQTTDGYLWLGTDTGLYRFDGVRFESYVPRSDAYFLSTGIFSLLAPPDGGLWICYKNSGVGFLKDGKLTNYGESDGLPPGRINMLARDSDGAIWAAGARLARLEGSRWQGVGPDSNYTGQRVLSFFFDKAGTLWVATEDTILFLPKGAGSFQSTGEKVGQVSQMAQSPDGTIWMAETTRGVRQLPLPGIDWHTMGPEVNVGSVAFLFDRAGALWITSIGDGMRRVTYPDRLRGKQIEQFGTEAEIFTEQNGLTGNYMTAIFEDREGNIWAGTPLGLDRFRETAVASIRFPPGEQAFGLAQGDDGDVWVTSNRSFWVIHKHDTDPTKIETKYMGAPWSGNKSVFRDQDGVLWFGGVSSIFIYKDDWKPTLVPPPELKIPEFSGFIWMIIKDRDGQIWAYLTVGGLFLIKDGVWERYERESELTKFAPQCGIIDSLNRKWFGSPTNIITLIDNERVRTFSVDDGVQAGDIKAIYERSGRVWAAGTLGIGVFVEEQFRMLAAEDAEVLRNISGMVETPNGSLWLNARQGIIHIPVEEVRLFLEDPAHKVRYRAFDFLDGLPGAVQQRPAPTAIEGSDGRLWFATNRGVAWIDPQRIPKNSLPPPVSISSLSTDEKLYEPSPSLELPKGTTRLQINFTALSLSIPERVRFRYKLEGVDEDWQDPGAERRTTYTSLGPGNYRFRVIASNNDGVWNEEGATLDFSIAPMFYQTLQFRILIFFLTLLLTAFMLYLLYRWRVRLVTRRLNLSFEERLAERTRIAHALHDTLLQGFFGASMRLQAVSNLLPAKSEKAKENLDDVLDQIDVVLEEGRRAIWDMSSSDAAEKDLGQALTLVGEDLNKTYPANFCLTIEGQNRQLHPLVRDQIYRIGREALINAFRHSKASKIELEIEYAPKHLRLTVRDNGCGIQPDVLSVGREGHLGLSGMRKYAEKIGAELNIWSLAESGTEVELIVPHNFAFEKESSGGFLRWLSR